MFTDHPERMFDDESTISDSPEPRNTATLQCGSGKFQAVLGSARGGADHQDWVTRTRSAVAPREKGLGAECLLHRGCSVMRGGNSFIYES